MVAQPHLPTGLEWRRESGNRMNERRTGDGPLYAPRYWPAWIGAALWRCLAFLPRRTGLALGRAAGSLLFHVLPGRRRVARINLALCFPDLDASDRERLLRAHFASLGAALAETALAWWGSTARVMKAARIVGLEHLEAAARDGRGVILLTGHFTPLELTGRILGETVPGVTAIYRANENPVLERLARKGRGRTGHTLRKQQTREIVRTLRAGNMIWYAPDQHHRGRQSAPVDFFGQPAATSLATPRLAELGQAAVVPYLPRRLAGTESYEIVLLPALDDFPSRDPLQDMARINALLEAWIRQQPEQYLWIHRRFKPADREAADPYASASA